jgi:hypothetical protein
MTDLDGNTLDLGTVALGEDRIMSVLWFDNSLSHEEQVEYFKKNRDNILNENRNSDPSE